MWEKVFELVGALGGWVVVTIAAGTWIGQRVAERLSLRWKANLEADLEKLRAFINRDYEVLRTAIGTLSRGHEHVQSKRIEAVEALWKAVIALRERLSPLYTAIDILLPEEYGELLHGRLARVFSQYSTESLAELVEQHTDPAESLRPYLSQRAWSLFWIYRAFLTRVVHRVVVGRDKGEITYWKEDSATMSLLESVLPREQMDRIRSQKLGGLNLARELLEHMLLAELQRIIFGHDAAELNLDQAAELARRALDLKEL